MTNYVQHSLFILVKGSLYPKVCSLCVPLIIADIHDFWTLDYSYARTLSKGCMLQCCPYSIESDKTCHAREGHCQASAVYSLHRPCAISRSQESSIYVASKEVGCFSSITQPPLFPPRRVARALRTIIWSKMQRAWLQIGYLQNLRPITIAQILWGEYKMYPFNIIIKTIMST